MDKEEKVYHFDQTSIEEIVNIPDDEAGPHCMRVTVSKLLVNPFEGGVFARTDKLLMSFSTTLQGLMMRPPLKSP